VVSATDPNGRILGFLDRLKYYYDNKIKNEVGETCGINWKAERYIDIFNPENGREEAIWNT
jgi:hypothetical protein